MRRRRLTTGCAMATAVVMLGACGGADVGATPPVAAGHPTSIALSPSVEINIQVSDSIVLLVEAFDESATRVPVSAADVRWRVTPESIATVMQGGLLHTQSLGKGFVVGEAGESLRDSVAIRVLPRPTGTFHIRFVYALDTPTTWRAALESAARRWEEVVTGTLDAFPNEVPTGACPVPSGEPLSPPVAPGETHVVIYVGQSSRFPEGTFVDATGGPCVQRPLPFATTVLGAITLNRDKPVGTIPPDVLRFVAVHELGHALGLVGTVQGEQPAWYDARSGRYTGAMAVEGVRRATGMRLTDLYTQGGHWLVHGLDDVMAAIAPTSQISPASIGALMDLGYPARWDGAGPY